MKDMICPVAPRVFITPHAKQRLDAYIDLCPDEISGLGTVAVYGNSLLITSVHLFPQEVTIGSTDLDPDHLQNFLLELVRNNEDPSVYKLWWHSHGYGSTFWSSTDDATCGRFNNDWMVALVGNKLGEYRCRLDLFEPFRVTIDNIPLKTHDPAPADLEKQIKAEIKEKVRRKKPVKGVLDGVHQLEWARGGSNDRD